MKCQNSITSNTIYKTEYQIEPNPYKKKAKQWPSIKKKIRKQRKGNNFDPNWKYPIRISHFSTNPTW